ncbi:MAG: trigger factor [Mycoplasmatales bacterium]
MEKVKKISNSKYEIEIDLTKEEIKKYIEQALTEDMKKVKEPGFRPGKMPKNIFLKKYGIAAVYPTAIDLIINDVYPKLITENNLKVIAQPEFDWTGVKIDENEGFSVKGSVEVMPEFEMIDFKKVKSSITKKEVKITKKEIKEEIDTLLAKDAKFEDKADYEAQNGDIVVIDFKGLLNGEAFEGGTAEGHSLTLGSGSFIPGFEEQLIGTKAGAEAKVEVTFPENYQAENLAGKDVVFECKVNAVKKRTLPRLTAKKIEELEGYEATSKEELETEIEKKLTTSRSQVVEFDYEKDVLTAMQKELALEIPKAMIEDETKHALDNFEANFKQQGLSLEMYLQMTGMTLDILKQQLNEESEKKIAKHLIIEKYLEENEVKISKKEIETRMEKLKEDYKLTEEQIIEQIGEDKKPLIRDLQYEKVNDLIFK